MVKLLELECTSCRRIFSQFDDGPITYFIWTHRVIDPDLIGMKFGNILQETWDICFKPSKIFFKRIHKGVSRTWKIHSFRPNILGLVQFKIRAKANKPVNHTHEYCNTRMLFYYMLVIFWYNFGSGPMHLNTISSELHCRSYDLGPDPRFEN